MRRWSGALHVSAHRRNVSPTLRRSGAESRGRDPCTIRCPANSPSISELTQGSAPLTRCIDSRAPVGVRPLVPKTHVLEGVMFKGVCFAFAVAALLAAALPSSAVAADKSFNVPSGDWFTDGNWNPAGVPGVGDNVTIPTGRT